MNKIVFFNMPAHGHTNPTLEVVRELVHKGNDVLYYSFAEFKAQAAVGYASHNRQPPPSRLLCLAACHPNRILQYHISYYKYTKKL